MNRMSNNHYNRIAAIGHWDKVLVMAMERGLDAAIEQYKPKPGATWNEIDDAANRLYETVVDASKDGKE